MKFLMLCTQIISAISVDGFVKASPACKRAVLETVEALRRQGHECVEIEIPSGEPKFFFELVSGWLSVPDQLLRRLTFLPDFPPQTVTVRCLAILDLTLEQVSSKILWRELTR